VADAARLAPAVAHVGRVVQVRGQVPDRGCRDGAPERLARSVVTRQELDSQPVLIIDGEPLLPVPERPG